MTGLASADVAVETVLLGADQPLPFEPRDKLRWIDNAAPVVDAPGKTDDMARQAATRVGYKV